jgi:hypothetical protein
MNIRTAEDQLFAEWRMRRSGLVADGVVDESSYLQSTPKLLFVLKEVNDTGGGGWDLREFLRNDGGRVPTWDAITRWVVGIRRLPEDIPWCELDKITEVQRCATLKSIAAINLKKSPGGHTADDAAIAKVSGEDAAFLKKQCALYRADIIVCCGTGDQFHRVVSICELPEWRRTRRGVWFYEYESSKYVVSYAHPEARCASNFLYYGLIDAIREILVPAANATS